MRNFWIFFFISFITLGANAQVAKWHIQPEYDTIYMAPGIDAIITESAKTKTLWDFNGKRLAVTENELREFREGRAIVAIPGETDIDCILTEDGQAISLYNCSYAAKFPYYSCGKLLVYDSERHCYKFLKLNGEAGRGQYLEDTYPFFNGYARCQILGEKDKRNVVLVDENEDVLAFQNEKGKNVKREDVLFVSSVNDDNVAIVVIKENVYTFDGKTKVLTPFYVPGMETSSKNHAKIDKTNMIDGRFSITPSDEGIWGFSAVCGDKKLNKEVVFEFDEQLRLIFYSVDGVKTHYTRKKDVEKTYPSSLTIRENSVQVGICWENGEEMLPPQFEEVKQCFDNKAFVKLAGKYGMLEINKDMHFDVKLNGGKDVGFIHKDFKTELRVDLPVSVPAEVVSLEVDSDSGIVLDRTSRQETTTRDGNSVKYDCELSIPEGLTDEKMEVTYPIQLTYDRLKAPWMIMTVREYFYKKFDIEFNEKSINNGALTLDFVIKDYVDDKQAINLEVNVSAYTLVTDSAITDTVALATPTLVQGFNAKHYIYRVDGLHEGINTVVIDVAEPDCPISSFSYDMEYHKLVAKTPTTEETKEKVEQKGSTKVVVKSRYSGYSTPKPTPKLTPNPNPKPNPGVKIDTSDL